MDLFNENVLPSDICNGFYAGIGSFAAIVVLIVAYIILKKEVVIRKYSILFY